MQIYKIQNKNPKDIFEIIGCDKTGAKIMSQKATTNMIYIKNLSCGAVNILKQEAISVGGDVATPKGAIICDKKFYSVVLMVSNRQIDILSNKLKSQPFELRELSQILQTNKTKPKTKTKLMGVLNINNDSFYDKSRNTQHQAIAQIEQLINQKADIIDIGAVSSRPGSEAISAVDELNRIKELIKQIHKQKLYDKVQFSIDSYEPLVVRYALEHGFKIVNDITGLTNDNIAKLVSQFEATAVIMHMQKTPQTMQDNPTYDDVIADVDRFFAIQITKAQKFAIKNIILDVGIGFGKTTTQNLRLLKHMEHFRKYGLELLVGVSRKSIIDDIYPSSPNDRLAGSIALHLSAVQNGVSIIRCHDIKEHRQALDMIEAMDDIVI